LNWDLIALFEFGVFEKYQLESWNMSRLFKNPKPECVIF